MGKIVIKLTDGTIMRAELVDLQNTEIIVKDIKYKNVVSESKIHKEVHVMKMHVVYYYVDE